MYTFAYMRRWGLQALAGNVDLTTDRVCAIDSGGGGGNHLNGYQESSMHFLSLLYSAEMPAAPNGLYAAYATYTWGKGPS